MLWKTTTSDSLPRTPALPGRRSCATGEYQIHVPRLAGGSLRSLESLMNVEFGADRAVA